MTEIEGPAELEFPLYTSLVEEACTLTSIPDVMKHTQNLPTEYLEVIMALIFHHHHVMLKMGALKQKKIPPIPFGGKTFDSGKGVIFHLKDLPENLQKILVCYIRKCINEN
jgi:hypothetical protein